MFFRLLLMVFVVMMNLEVTAQTPDSVMISQIIRELEQEQLPKTGRFEDGMFYSYRKFAGYPQRFTPDENIFFTAIISFALKNMSSQLNATNKDASKRIINRAVKAYPAFQNKNKLPIYFFWRKEHPIMPHSLLIEKIGNKLATSEDLDDTVMIFMTDQQEDSTIRKLKKLMELSSNGKNKYTKTTYPQYKQVPAYTTYFGKNMLADFDFAVQCNIVYFLMDQKLPLNNIDSATIFLLEQMIKNRDYINDPTYISPYYVHSPILLYHIARLMGRFKIAALEPYRNQLIDDMKMELTKSTNIMTDIILNTSLLRLGSTTKPLPIKDLNQFKNSNQDQFVFYQARAAILFPNPFKRLFLNFSLLKYHFFSPAYNKTLLLEYLVERNKS